MIIMEDEQNPSQKKQPTIPSLLSPGRVFLISSIPLTLGTYVGYRRALHESSFSMQSTKTPKSSTAVVSTVPPPVIAARALLVGTLLSLSTTSILVAGTFYASGCQSLEELMTTWKRWAPRKLRDVEHAMGLGAIGDERRSSTLEYKRAVKGLSEEEEIEYVRKNYGGDVDWDEKTEDEKEKKQ
jgi:hypothetical protein